MQPYLKNLSRFCATEASIVYGNNIFSSNERLELLEREPFVSAYLTLCLNTRSIIMFEQPIVDVEIIQTHGSVRLNFLNEKSIPASEIGPIAIEAWEIDLIHNSEMLPSGQICIDEPMQIFRDFLKDQPDLVPQDAMVAPFYSSEIIYASEIIESGKNAPDVPATHNLGAHVIHILRERAMQDTENSRTQEYGRDNEVKHV